MSSFNKQIVFEVARSVKAFMNLRPGEIRGEATGTERSHARELERARQQILEQERELAQMRAKLQEKDAGGSSVGIDPGKLIWIFGTARVGSTWLGAMMEDLESCTLWHEPLVGQLFSIYYRAEHRRGRHFILGPQHKETWLGSIRNVVLDGANARFPDVAEDGYLIIKEPNGSVGAPLLMEALPESRLILLVRDPRDVAASALDASRKDGWLSVRRGESRQPKVALAEKNPDALVREVANRYLRYVGNSKQAYEAHGGLKALVKYEDLRADTPGTMRRICSALKMEVDQQELAAVVEKHSWANVPEEEKGEGRFRRKAAPGGWRADLSPEQVEIVEKVTAPLLEEFYPA